MDPTECFGTVGEVRALDLAAFDAIGWNLASDARSPTYLATTSDIYYRFVTVGSVPEPAAWTLMIAGFGLVGAALRRRARIRMRVAFAA